MAHSTAMAQNNRQGVPLDAEHIADETGFGTDDEVGEDDTGEAWTPLFDQISLHPRYLAVLRRAISLLFYCGAGPILSADRHFIALMAASRHRCVHLMDLHRREYVRCGGDAERVRTSMGDVGDGLEKAPEKLKKLDLLNRLLAHRPWLVRPHHLEALTARVDPSSSSTDGAWSLSELVQAVTILSHTHALASFVLSCSAFIEEQRSRSTPPAQPPSLPAPIAGGSVSSFQNGGDHHHVSDECDCEEVESLMRKMEQLKCPSSSGDGAAVDSPDEELERQFDQIGIETSTIGKPPATPTDGALNTSPRSSFSSFRCFTDDSSFEYVDFAKRPNPNESPTFKIHDYSWEDQGYSVVSQFYGELSELLNDKFHLMQELTYNTMGGHENVDTTKYRTAVWNYIQSVYGIRHDDYNYAEVNEMLNVATKTFIKTACCFPERTNAQLRQNFMQGFQHSEKVQVMLMILESRLQAELLYFLRAVMRFMT